MYLKNALTTATLIVLVSYGTVATAQNDLDTDGEGIPDIGEPLLVLMGVVRLERRTAEPDSGQLNDLWLWCDCRLSISLGQRFLSYV